MRSFTVHDAEPADIAHQGSLAAVDLRPAPTRVREVYCKTCGTSPVVVQRVLGRWDPERQATALPFDPVAAHVSCGCVVGDPALARPADGAL